jgi:hypothetical protein
MFLATEDEAPEPNPKHIWIDPQEHINLTRLLPTITRLKDEAYERYRDALAMECLVRDRLIGLNRPKTIIVDTVDGVRKYEPVIVHKSVARVIEL